MKNKFAGLLIVCLILVPTLAKGLEVNQDADHDGLLDSDEIGIYHTDPSKADTDGDGFSDGEEVKYSFDPNKALNDKLEKHIEVNLKEQSLSYGLGPYEIKTFKISSGDRKHPTPAGDYSILVKKPLVTYKGTNYFYPNTRWNMMFKRGSLGNLYIHGAYWHNKFGQRMSHGCINVSYQNMESLYNWTDEGVKVTIE
jgi:lipoprotein-anchoring transpeptidase ErfK/SrfK